MAMCNSVRVETATLPDGVSVDREKGENKKKKTNKNKNSKLRRIDNF